MSDESEQTGGTLVEQRSSTIIPARVGKRDWTPAILTGLIMGGFFYVLHYLLNQKVPVESRDIVLQMIETLKNVVIMCVGYYFGTTQGSEKKTDLLAKAGPVDPR